MEWNYLNAFVTSVIFCMENWRKKKRKLEYESRIRIEKKGKLCEEKGRNEWNIE